ncbi:hypothetical protein [Phenylobacterium conjunctum]|uniref:ATP-binding protein n=1 Tax=Phenylobacterium conjunctum TaxID=1298959 RepID=A0ABW3T486_9CAUL
MAWALAPKSIDVQRLGDVALRELVVRLITGDLAAAGLPTTAVKAGGDQTAPDGGIDVRVEGDFTTLDNVPAIPLGVQVKAEKMPAAKIGKEMRPKDKPRAVFAELAAAGGAYVIVSGRDNTSDEQLRLREAAMRLALRDVPGGENLKVRFYDSDQVARWAAGQPGVSLWLAREVGAPRDGWIAHGRWASPNDASDLGYLGDSTSRARFSDSDGATTVTEALARLKTHLAEPKAVARLVGLSGMGKTRLAQALFEEQGEAAKGLSVDLAVYGDVGGALGVTPELLAAQLAETGTRAVLVVDNCNAELHRRLTQIVRGARGALSLLTIDFDVGDDRPEDTLILRLEPAADDLIERLLHRRFPRLGLQDRMRIAQFSGGNSRVALALAAATRGVSIEKLNDRELLDRLFLTGRRGMDDDLRRVARAMSLFGAIDLNAERGPEEIATIRRLSEVSEIVFHEKVRELLDRGLAQQRGTQRAVLPQALALRLADDALNNLPPRLPESAIMVEGPARLADSFLKRLGTMSQNPVARQLGADLLAPGGKLVPVDLSHEDPWNRLAHLAPLAPQRALEIALEAVGRADPEDDHFRYMVADKLARLLMALAFDDALFCRATLGLADLLQRLPSPHGLGAYKNDFLCLFQARQSGTFASQATRNAVIDELLRSPVLKRQNLGIEALCASLRTSFERMSRSLAFGDRLPEAGWKPQGTEEWRAWYASALLATEAALARPEYADRLMPRLATLIGEMLRYEDIRDLGVAAMRRIAGGKFWRQGWVEVSRCVAGFRRHGKDPPEELSALEGEMRPSTIADRFEAWVQGYPNHYIEALPDHQNGWAAFENHGRALGAEAAASAEAYDYVVPRALRKPASYPQAVGEGYGAAIQDLNAAWTRLVAELETVNATEQEPRFLVGFLQAAAKRQPQAIGPWLDAALAGKGLRRWTVELNSALGPLAEPEARRVLRALEMGAMTAASFEGLVYGRRTFFIPNPLMADIFRGLMKLPGGLAVAAALVAMRYHGGKEAPLDAGLLVVGRELLDAIAEDGGEPLRSTDLMLIATTCLVGAAGAKTARRISRRMVSAADQEFQGGWVDNLPSLILERFPAVGLDEFLGGRPSPNSYKLEHLLGGGDSDDHPNNRPLNGVDDQLLQAWVLKAPDSRAARLARFVGYFEAQNDTFRWTPIALWLLDLRDAGDVGRIFSDRFHVGSWSGSEESRFVRRLNLTAALVDHHNPSVAAWGREQHEMLLRIIKEIEQRKRAANEKFE